MPNIEELRKILFDIHPLLVPVSGFAILALLAWLADVIARRRLVALAHGIARRSSTAWDDIVIQHGVIRRAARLLPAIVIYIGIPLIPGINETFMTVLQSAALAVIELIIILSISAGLGAVNSIYELRPDAQRRPIKGYIQITQIILICIGVILIFAAVLNKSPIILLSGFGAATAILLLVFRDTILSLVASIQLSGLDMVRVGDWIEMPEYSADGDVIDVALHTVRVQNWDKTITTIPTHRLITDSFRNWRGMSESGGRRIKRAMLVDMASVRFLTDEEVKRFRRFSLLKDYVDEKRKALAEYNEALESDEKVDVNLRRLTNLGMFRAYVFNYLKYRPDIHKDMTLLVRQLEPRPEGMPIEIYCFTNTTGWQDYERIQADIFDFLLAILREFGLRAYQQPSGADLARLGGRQSES